MTEHSRTRRRAQRLGHDRCTNFHEEGTCADCVDPRESVDVLSTAAGNHGKSHNELSTTAAKTIKAGETLCKHGSNRALECRLCNGKFCDCTNTSICPFHLRGGYVTHEDDCK